ncbi:NAD-dependent epimerase/dehydratase family protein [Candidatus Eisenbacteria bacterium]|uniref:NAD-dependent epimerase/dehydratase family protein n=1 Tax=Eiseniibacteriota bacterium TaxID=2212470 RepID=A0ABV6YLB9_UNCEI
MKVLVTGDRGVIGKAVCDCLRVSGDEPVGFDIVNGHDVLNQDSVIKAALNCDSIVHLAAVDDEIGDGIPSEFQPYSQGSPEHVVAVTVLGTLHILEAAKLAGHSRVIFMSSVDALGVFMGQRPPDYLPIDNEHPTYPSTPYALAKRMAERMCEDFTKRTDISTICLRPPGVWTEEIFDFIRKRWEEDPTNDRKPFWEYGAFIALSDVAKAIICAVHTQFSGHIVLNISSDEVALASQTSYEAASEIHPSVRWQGGKEYEINPYRTLLDNTVAKSVLNWKPQIRFKL